MRSLFVKIFLAFWVTVILTGIALALTFVLGPEGPFSQWHATLHPFATDMPPGPRGMPHAHGGNFLWRWGIALFVSGFICYVLTRYLTTPILRLRETTRQLAMGELGARAPVGMDKRRDEIGDLVRDFNFMAGQMEGLVTSQRQLISDVSHELRSPLARLNVALGLARKRLGSDPALERMEREAERLNEMIGRLLTVARLDTSLLDPQMSPVDLNALLAEIVADAEFESREHECTVQLSCQGQWRVKANPDLLRSAIENIIRNAIRYTASGTPVDVRLENRMSPTFPSVVVSVRDHGPGVPEAELANIFRPFYRVSDARDRQSGGVGLGLAIADRVARLHGGSVRACNTPGGGLQVDLTVPTTHA